MSKSLTMLLRVVCVLTLMAQPLHDAAARPSSSSSHSSSSHSSSSSRSSSGSSKSFSSGFSSRKSSSSSSPSSSSSASPSTSFGSRSSPASAPSPGGFGSFGKRAADGAPQRSDSAVSQQLTKQQAEANALRTLDARRSQSQYGGAPPARNDADRGMQGAPAPSYGPSYGPAPAPHGPVVIQRDSGLGSMVGGYVLGRMANHNNNGYARPGYTNNGNNGGYAAPAGTASGGTSFLGGLMRLVLWVGMLALLVWGVVAIVRRVRRRREENKPNYSFQRRG